MTAYSIGEIEGFISEPHTDTRAREDQWILFGLACRKHVCTTVVAPFQSELVESGEPPSFHGKQAYVRYFRGCTVTDATGRQQPFPDE